MVNYDTFYSERANTMKASEIRELLKLTNQPDIISFAGGLPNPKAFPVTEIRELSQHVIKTYSDLVFQYAATEGVVKLRYGVAKLMQEIGVKADFNNILVTSGSQQGLDLLGKVFLNKGDHVIVGSPTYLGALQAFNAYLPRYVACTVDESGLNADEVEKIAKSAAEKGDRIKFLYTIPNFQNPAGVTMSIERRKRLIELARKYDFLIIEDDPYGKLRYDGVEVPPIKSMDTEGRVIYLGTFSKILSPGFRVAWLVSTDEIFKKLALAKSSSDLCTSPLTQFIAAEFLERGMLPPHLVKMNMLYKGKKDRMIGAMKAHFPKEVKFTTPEGGLFIWATAPEYVDTTAMFREAIKERVAYVVGSAFYVGGKYRNSMRLNFSFATDQEIDEGIRRLGCVLGKEIAFAKEQKIWSKVNQETGFI